MLPKHIKDWPDVCHSALFVVHFLSRFAECFFFSQVEFISLYTFKTFPMRKMNIIWRLWYVYGKMESILVFFISFVGMLIPLTINCHNLVWVCACIEAMHLRAY